MKLKGGVSCLRIVCKNICKSLSRASTIEQIPENMIVPQRIVFEPIKKLNQSNIDHENFAIWENEENKILLEKILNNEQHS